MFLMSVLNLLQFGKFDWNADFSVRIHTVFQPFLSWAAAVSASWQQCL